MKIHEVSRTGLFQIAATASSGEPASCGERASAESVFAKDNLVAWCIVPFDAKKRGPSERAEMLKRLGIKKLAYDWRQEHVPTFEQEILALRKHGVEFFAFWGEHEDMFRLFEKHGIAPQVWKTAPSPKVGAQAGKVETAAKQLLPLAVRMRELGCKLGLYNHGGWGGEPGNLVAVCEWLRKNAGADHVSIVYNFHHGHGHIEDFAEAFAQMKPYLLCLNINGMNDGGEPKVLPLGQGQREKEMIRIVRQSDYSGPIGIIGHRFEVDAEQSLIGNLEGLKNLLGQLGDAAAAKTYCHASVGS